MSPSTDVMDPGIVQARTAVDELLMEQGQCHPLDLLLREGRLRYTDYEAWRIGGVGTLEQRLIGGVQPTLVLLRAAGDYAELLALGPESLSYSGWGAAAARTLDLGGADFARLLGRGWRRERPQREGGQFDLFFDSRGVVLSNEVRASLVQRNLDQVRGSLGRLAALDPGHVDLPVLKRLGDALAGWRSQKPRAILQEIRGEIVPLARAQLGGQARDFLALLWGRLAQDLAGVGFDPDIPELHVSWALLQREQWEGVVEAVRNELGWRDQPILRERLALACWRLGHEDDALAQWFDLCWRFPAHAEDILDSRGFPERTLRGEWHDLHEIPLQPDPGIDLLPAWTLMRRPYLAGRRLGVDWAPEAFEIVCHLVRRPDDIGLRATLREAEPRLLELFLGHLGVDRSRASAAPV